MNRSLLAGLSLLSAGLLLALAPAAHAQLQGQDVHLDYLFPDTSTIYEDDGTQTVTAGGVTFNSFGQVFTTVTPGQISIGYTVSTFFTPASFNGIHLSEVGASPITITSVSIDGVTNEPGFDSSRISFTGTDIFVNLESLTLDPSLSIVLDVNGSVSNVPEPGSVALLVGMGISGAGFLVRRKRSIRK